MLGEGRVGVGPRVTPAPYRLRATSSRSASFPSVPALTGVNVNHGRLDSPFAASKSSW